MTAHDIPTRLGSYISEQSPIKFMERQSRFDKAAGKARRQRTFRGRPMQLRSSQKLHVFYAIGPALLALTTAAILLYGPHRTPEPRPLPSPAVVNVTVEPAPPAPSAPAPSPTN